MRPGLKDFIDLVVPHYLLITIFGPISAYMIITGSIPGVAVIPIVLALSFGALGFNTINMVFDEKIDRITKPLRPIVRGVISRKSAIIISFLFYFLSLAISLSVNFTVFLLMILFFILTFTYSFPRIYYKKYFWASSFCGSIVYGVIPFLAVQSITSAEFSPHFLMFFFLLYFIISNCKDFEDMSGESMHGIKSIPTVFGAKKSALIIIFSEFLLLFFTIYSSLVGIIDRKYIFASAVSILMLLPISWLFWKDMKKITYRDIAFVSTRNSELNSIITQSDGVTFSILFAVIVQILFGLVSVSL